MGRSLPRTSRSGITASRYGTDPPKRAPPTPPRRFHPSLAGACLSVEALQCYVTRIPTQVGLCASARFFLPQSQLRRSPTVGPSNAICASTTTPHLNAKRGARASTPQTTAQCRRLHKHQPTDRRRLTADIPRVWTCHTTPLRDDSRSIAALPATRP